jgi:hypothetical protein
MMMIIVNIIILMMNMVMMKMNMKNSRNTITQHELFRAMRIWDMFLLLKFNKILFN